MNFGKQNRYCANCGKHLYDSNLSMTHVKSMLCSDSCREEWEMKYSRAILGKDENPKIPDEKDAWGRTL